MLIELHIRDFALIDELRIETGSGLAVLTGETGAGKSIIVDALSAALGERTGVEVVRTGADKCLVEAVFDVSDARTALETASEYGVETEDGLLIVSREIARNGKSAWRINGRATTVAALKDITARLVDVHGQHEHQSLLSVAVHIDSLDAWIGDSAASLRTEARQIYDELSALKEERSRLHTDERERARMLDLYQFQVAEINAAALDPAEAQELEDERNRLANAEKLYEAASEVYAVLGGGDNGVVDALSAAAGLADKIAAMDPSMSGFVDDVCSALFASQESLATVRDYRERVEANPGRLEQVEERLDTIRALKRKYGDTIEDILDYARDLESKIDSLSNSEQRSRALDGRIDEMETALSEVASRLGTLRRKACSAFEKAVEKELSELAMGRTTFVVSLTPIEPGPKGADGVEFLISPNPGEPVKPLAKIASGGEMSRIMLALKTVMARADIPVMVFDEIDAGIGGRTAQVLADKLASLAERCQVMCVTHLVQIASKADRHYNVDKVVRDGRAVITVRELDEEERVSELARMLGAEETSASAAAHAREMLSLARNGNA